MVTESSTEVKKIWELLATVNDPEVPVLTVLDLGIVRDVQLTNDQVDIIITPTYSGCPAMDAISMDIKFKLIEAGYKNVKVISVLSPAWTTDWISEAGKQKLKEYGIAPPNAKTASMPKRFVCTKRSRSMSALQLLSYIPHQ